MDECVACELSDGRRSLPGGLIHRTDHWLVEHCIGSLGLGTLIVKPERHVTSMADLTSMSLGN
jgi:diadenosine tetraphosphate (Ap4A) HIT family hydrolase